MISNEIVAMLVVTVFAAAVLVAALLIFK